MKDERLEEFMSKIDFTDGKVAIYSNEERGCIYPITIPTLLCRVDCLELSSSKKPAGELEIAKFRGQIEDKEYTIIDLEKLVPKSEITHNEDDLYTITKKTYKGAKIYNVSNQAGIFTSFEDKESAIKLCNEINKKVLEMVK